MPSDERASSNEMKSSAAKPDDAGDPCVAACEPCMLLGCEARCESPTDQREYIATAADCDAVRTCIMGPSPGTGAGG